MMAVARRALVVAYLTAVLALLAAAQEPTFRTVSTTSSITTVTVAPASDAKPLPQVTPTTAVPQPTAAAAAPAGATVSQAAGPTCDPRLLVNGMFDRSAPSSLANAFLMAELANAAYPSGMAVVANTKLGTAAYQAAFSRKWKALGVTGDITFLDTTTLAGIGATLSASAIIFHTPTDVFLIYRGLAGAAAALGTMKTTPGNVTLLGQTVAVHGGFLDSWRLVASNALSAVQTHLALTSQPSAARVFLAGHSMGGVHALLSAMQLLEGKVPLGGVYLYGLPKPGRQNFVNLFSSRPQLSSITYVWWNEMDLVPSIDHPDNSKTALGSKAPPLFVALPDANTWRIWSGTCSTTGGWMAARCPMGGARCKNQLDDHYAYQYTYNLQTCLLARLATASSPSSACYSSIAALL